MFVLGSGGHGRSGVGHSGECIKGDVVDLQLGNGSFMHQTSILMWAISRYCMQDMSHVFQ